MARPFFVFICLSLLLSASCTQRLICPAYQSAFIYDKDELRKKFSYFLEDSTPKVFTASKTRYLIAEPVSYRKKVRSLQTVAMKPVDVHLPDSLQIGEGEGDLGEDGVVVGAELDLAARSVIDSIYIEDVPTHNTEELGDSIYVISKDKEVRFLKYDFPDSLIYDENSGRYVAKTPKYVVEEVRFNVEQDNYMWYLRRSIVLPDVRLSQLMQAQDRAEARKRNKKGLFKNLFKRKKKVEVDSATLLPPAKSEDDFDYVDENGEVQGGATAMPEAQKKKGFFSFLKKKEKKKKERAEVPEEAAPPKEKKKKKPKDEAEPKVEEDGF